MTADGRLVRAIKRGDVRGPLFLKSAYRMHGCTLHLACNLAGVSCCCLSLLLFSQVYINVTHGFVGLGGSVSHVY